MTKRTRASVAIIAATLLALVTTSSARGQRFVGTVLDADTDQPIGSARVVLLDAGNDSIATVLSGEEGRFVLVAPKAGVYRIGASRLGYESLATGTMNIEFNELVTVALTLTVSPIGLDGFSVVSRDRDVLNDLSYDALYARRALNRTVGSNRVFVKDDLEFQSALKTSDLLRYVPPRKQEFDGRTQTWSACNPIIVWHGFVVRRDFQIEELLEGSADNLEGLESYRSYASLPLAIREEVAPYVTPVKVRECGVVVLWPRRPDYPRKE